MTDPSELFEIVSEAVEAALDAHHGSSHIPLARRLIGGRILFEDDDGREVRAVPVEAVFKKITSVREKLRVLEQKLNNHPNLDATDKAELQGYITRAYGSLTTFNFLFADEDDRFKGQGGG